jgi:hypothetical protein
MKKLLFLLTLLAVSLSYAAPRKPNIPGGGVRGTRQLVLICKDTKTGRSFNIIAPIVGIADRKEHQRLCTESGGDFMSISAASAKYTPVFSGGYGTYLQKKVLK